jgi:hypothetical protein
MNTLRGQRTLNYELLLSFVGKKWINSYGRKP